MVSVSDEMVEISMADHRQSPVAYDHMEDALGQAWVPDAEEVWRLATVKSASSSGNTIYVYDADGEFYLHGDSEIWKIRCSPSLSRLNLCFFWVLKNQMQSRALMN